MSLGLILVIILVIFLLGGFSGRFGGYGYGYGQPPCGSLDRSASRQCRQNRHFHRKDVILIQAQQTEIKPCRWGLFL